MAAALIVASEVFDFAVENPIYLGLIALACLYVGLEGT